MRQIGEAKFFRKRAAEEHQLALEANDPAAARIHRQLAECYERMARETQRRWASLRYEQDADHSVAQETKTSDRTRSNISASHPPALGASVLPGSSTSE